MVQLAHFLYTNLGVAIASADVAVFTVATAADETTSSGSATATTTTNSAGFWQVTGLAEGIYDVRITSGSSIRWRRYNTEMAVKRIEVADLFIRNPADTFNYVVTPAAIVAERILTLPLLTGTATLVVTPAVEDLNLDGFNIDNGGVIFLKEQAEADADVAGSGQLWVDTATPNTLFFTDDAGTDFQIGLAQSVQADIEAETNENKYIPADLLHFSPGMAKGWINVPANGVVTPSAANSYNVASVTDSGVGARITLWATDFDNTTYAPLAASNATDVSAENIDPAASAAQSAWFLADNDATATAVDNIGCSLAFGGQA